MKLSRKHEKNNTNMTRTQDQKKKKSEIITNFYSFIHTFKQKKKLALLIKHTFEKKNESVYATSFNETQCN